MDQITLMWKVALKSGQTENERQPLIYFVNQYEPVDRSLVKLSLFRFFPVE